MANLALSFQHDIETLPAMLAFNYNELKASLTEYLGKFEGLVVTEDAIAEAKEERAKINATRDAISRARIDIKKRAFDEFEKKAKDLEAMCDKASGAIDEQLKAFENARKAKKRELIDATLTEVITGSEIGHGELADSPRWTGWVAECCARRSNNWLNVNPKLEKIREEMEAEVARVIADSKTLESFTANDSVAVQTLAMDAFKKTFNLADAMGRVTAYKEEQKRIAEAEAARAARKAAEEAARAAAPAPTVVDTQPATKPVEAPSSASSSEPLMVYRLEVRGTRDQLKALRAFIDANGIAYTKI